ncbi:MAG: hypothetical protein M0Q38_16585 [Bacteroidales bacterium]|jgi:hypothetical protein|nr:hypothetical protein [Bacteroidales bacterium]
MKRIQRIIGVILVLLPLLIKAELKEIPFTLDDRDRIIRTEQKVESVKTEMTTRFQAVDQRFEAMDKRFDQLFNFLWAIVGIFTAMMISVFGFAFWDRKLSLAPLKKEDQRIVAVLVDFAKTQPKLSEILKNAGLL